MNRGDFDSAHLAMDKWCDGGGKIDGNGAGYIWYSGSAIAYACNYSRNQQGCTSSEYNTMSQLVDVACGSSTAGWVGISDWAKSYGNGQ